MKFASSLISALRRSLSPEKLTTDAITLRLRGGKAVRLRGRTTAQLRIFDGSAYNGGVMYPELTVNGRVENGPVVLDLDSLDIPQPQRPVLYDHDETPGAEIGQTTMIAVRKSDYTLPVKGVLYAARPRAQEVMAEAAGGREWQLSVGTNNRGLQRVAAGVTIRVNGRSFVGPLTVIRNAVLTDLSFVKLGGDDTTWATLAARSARKREAAMRRLIVAVKPSRNKPTA